MPDFEIIAGEGVPPIKFGMTPEQVREVMGEPDPGSGPGGAPVPGAWTYFNGALLVNTDEDDRVDYIELSPIRGLRAIYKGVSVFEVPPAEVARLVGGPMDADDLESFDVEADVGLSRGNEDGGWDSIGVGTGQHFARLR